MELGKVMSRVEGSGEVGDSCCTTASKLLHNSIMSVLGRNEERSLHPALERVTMRCSTIRACSLDGALKKDVCPSMSV